MIPAKEACYIHGEEIKFKESGRISYVATLIDLRDGHSELQVIDDPEVSVYVTKPQYRMNTAKKEVEEMSHLDMYRCPVAKVTETLWKALQPQGRGYSFPPHYIPPKKMLDSPYVYGADIDYGVHLKLAYDKANGGRKPTSYNTGFLDIETDVNGTNQIILITFMNGDGSTFVAILKEFFLDHTTEEVERMWHDKVEPDFRSKLNKKGLDVYTKSGGIKLNLKICEDEVELLKWTFGNIHRCKPNFIGVWNIDYDVPFILNRCEFRGIDPANLFCPPDLPMKYRVCRYKPDPGKEGGHLVDRWPWLHCTSYSRWYDAMMCYGRLRKAKPREPSYRLDAIGGKEIGAGKLSFGDGEGHSTMQRFHQVEYTVYNIVDVLIMRVMELKNKDVMNMMMLIGVSTLDCFAHQSVQLKNSYYDYLAKKGCVPASIGNRIDDPWDPLIKNKGGAVLDPSRANIAVPSLTEDDIVVRGARFVCDIDVSSMYPSFMAAMNVGKESKIATVLRIDNTRRRGLIKYTNSEDLCNQVTLAGQDIKGLKVHDVTEFFADAIYTEANAIEVGKRFNLPGFDGIDQWMAKHQPQVYAAAKSGAPVEPAVRA